MIINHSKKIVYDYINGEYIDNVDELENDLNFMIDVINITRDKKMYNLCSDSLKNNHEFIMFIIDTFKKDKNFVNDVVKEYMKKIDTDDFRYKELCFVMSNIFNDREDGMDIYYNLLRTAIYSSERMSIDYVVSTEKDMYVKKQMGLGFMLVLYSDLGKSDIITDYFAIKYLEELFYEKENMTFEDFIHSKFPLLKTLQKVGIKNFIIDYVRDYDTYLSDYLFAHINLIKDVEKSINRVINRWDSYLERNLRRKRDIFEQEVDNLITLYNPSFDYFDACVYLDKLNLHIPFKFSFFEEDDDICFIDMKNIELNDYKCLQKIVNLAKSLFLSTVIDKNYNSYENDIYEDNYKGRVLKFKANNN